MQNPMPPDAAKEIEHVKSLVARHFPVYDVRVNYDVVEFYCKIDEDSLEESFERLREEMIPQGYIPMITYVKGEHVLVVGKKPSARHRSAYVNLAMLMITLITVTFAGILYWGSYAEVPGDEVYSPHNIAMSVLVFTLPLLAILGTHELAHFFAARRRRVAASLPFFIPSIPPFGTFGAFISLRDPIPNRKALLDIGVAGPIAGLLVAIMVGVAGLMLTNMEAKVVPDDLEPGDSLSIAFPLIYIGIEQLVPIEGDYLLHPMAFAAWVGFWVTAINLLPAGQLDGGHIARAVFGKHAKYASWATIAVLVGLSFFFLAWVILAILILVIGSRHPPPLNDINKLDTKRKALGIFAFIILVLAFVPVPMWITEIDHSFEITLDDGIDGTLSPGETAVLSFHVESLGNVKSNLTIEFTDAPADWDVLLKPSDTNPSDYSSAILYQLNVSENMSFDASITPSETAAPGNQTITITGYALSPQGEVYFEGAVQFNITVEGPSLDFWLSESTLSVSAGEEATTGIQVNNTENGTVEIVMTALNSPSMVGVALYEDSLDVNSTWTLNLTVPAQSNSSFEVLIVVFSQATPGETILYIQATYHEIVLETIDIAIIIE